MTLRQLLKKYTKAGLAKRLGVTPATISRGLSQGLSKRLKEKLATHAKKSLAAQKAAKTRRKREKFQAKVPTPPASELTRKQVAPRETPRPTPTRRRQLHLRRGERRYETNRYIGKSEWFFIDKQANEIDIDEVQDRALASWHVSDLPFHFTYILAYRYIPFNPAYKGQLSKLQGTWVEINMRTETLSSAKVIANQIQALFDGYTVRRGKKVQGLLTMNETRVIWVKGIEFVNFGYKKDLGWEDAGGEA